MKLLLLKILFINQPKDKGYVIPVVFALGLIMTLIGTISIFQSSDEQVISISQRQSSRALAAAEAGIARYREQIDRYNIISMYDACDGGAWAANGTCNNSGSGIESWRIAGLNIPNLDSYCPPAGDTVANTVEALATRTWQNIGADASQGQYRLIDYTYAPGTLIGTGINATYDQSVGGVQPQGTLTVEGRVNQNNTNLVNEPGSSVSSIQVILPIQPGLPNPDGVISVSPFLNNFNPALWIVGAPDAANIDLGDIQVNGNIVVSDNDCVHSGSLPLDDDFVNSTQNSVVIDPRSPSVVVDPSDAAAPSAPTPDPSEVEGITLAELTTQSLPLTGDTPTADVGGIGGDDVYYYKLVDASGNLGSSQDLNLIAGDTINIRNNRKVVLFVEGSLNITTGASDININPAAANNSSHLEIFMTDPISSTIQFSGNGNVNISALLHAPESPATVLGDPTVSFTGAMWIEDFTGKNLTNAFSIIAEDQYLNYTYVYDFLVGANLRVTDAIIAPPLQWNTQQTQ